MFSENAFKLLAYVLWLIRTNSESSYVASTVRHAWSGIAMVLYSLWNNSLLVSPLGFFQHSSWRRMRFHTFRYRTQWSFWNDVCFIGDSMQVHPIHIEVISLFKLLPQPKNYVKVSDSPVLPCSILIFGTVIVFWNNESFCSSYMPLKNAVRMRAQYFEVH